MQMAFTRRILAGAKALGLHTAIETSGFLGDRVDDDYLVAARPRAARHQELRPARPTRTPPAATSRRRCASPSGSRRWAKPVWVRFTLVPGLTDDPANVEGIARFVAPMKNVEWVEVQPFHQLGAFKWKAMGLDYPNTPRRRRRRRS